MWLSCQIDRSRSSTNTNPARRKYLSGDAHTPRVRDGRGGCAEAEETLAPRH